MAVALAAGVQALARGRREVGQTARAWRLLGLSCLSWGCGQAAWTWYESVLGREVPFPSIADIGYLTFVPLAAAALLAFPSVPRRLSSRIRTVLDGLLIACALLFMSWMVVLGPLFDAGGDPFTLTIGLAYPLGDVVIITILLFASSHRSQRTSSSRASRPLLFAGLLAFAVADSGFVYLTNSGSYSSGSLIDIGWFCAFAAIFLAGTVRAVDAEPQSPDDDVPDRFAVLVPYVPVVLAVLLGGVRLAVAGRLGRFLGWNALALLMLAVIRQVAALLENLSLTTHLELRVQERTAELDRSEQRFRSLVQNSSDVITVVDGNGTITYQSPSIGRVLGHESGALLDTSYFDLVHLDDHVGLTALIESATLRQGTNIAAELRIRSSDGVLVPRRGPRHEPARRRPRGRHRPQRPRRHRAQGARAPARAPGLPRPAHQPRQPCAVRRPPGPRTRSRRPAGADPSPCSTSTSTASRGSTTHSATSPATSSSRRSRRASATCVRTGDTISRWGGDEFGILLEELATDAEANAAAERLIDALRDPFWVGIDRGVHQRQHRHRGVRARHRGLRRPPSLRRPGDVPGQGESSRLVLQVRAGDAGRRQGAGRARPRPPSGDRARRVVRRLPADRRALHRPDRRRRGAGSLDTPDPRSDPARRVHPGRRSQRLDRRPRRVRSPRSLQERSGLAGDPRRLHDQRQPLGTSAERVTGRHDPRRSWRRPGSSRRR